MIDVVVSSTDRAALWSALPTLPITWDALPEEGVTLPDGTHLRHSDAPDGEVRHLMVTLHESEDLEELTDGLGDYTAEELADPYAVIEQYFKKAGELVRDMVAEAAGVLGEPAQAEPDARGVSWLLPDRTISVGVTQADKNAPIEVCVWLLPPGHTADSLGL
ncbi:hypothetical protein LAJ19_09440 [Deinococcus taeanensis]|uniref:hypothetical protein n=1 Tax=Deinococcus taeanensis TaxID=2737050 RepID=UPI001CDC0169|nr:hypothetical protein [Deinococcus taeanensis]UBV41867.1 hypothetical protein LAJ19_09440 [Deinococcus taeanensis]